MPSPATEPTDWHPEDIKAAVRKTGVTLTALAQRHGLAGSAVRVTLIKPWPRVEAIVAAHLGRRPQDIWPSRYDASGQPLRGRRPGTAQASRSPSSPHRQKRGAR
ncbi:hypothetical protein GCM10010964_18330 [Caldovatus sediminis]|uniref:Ner winged helix-turn-helix DNA-binding domain-containing protein n=1 Tax=Caldovatus sediminis TaxID=2041189 RepID=A0A8J2ZB74_9PROT|nr:helix-turn-helix domain-containing protein [Caldovatus sediminis]GGG30745.1 hypothetical protein GCM10010964_18330 [Caldovatus sediminis]